MVHFGGSGTPASDFNKGHNTLFIPSNPNYPGYDFFYWDAQKNRIYAFQVTLTKPFTKHSKLDKESVKTNCDEWKNYCAGSFLPELWSFWVIPEECCYGAMDSTEDIYVVFLECLHNAFPALKKLGLGSE